MHWCCSCLERIKGRGYSRLSQVESGLGEEAGQDPGAVLQAAEPGLDQRDELVEGAPGQVDQAAFQVRPDGLLTWVT